MKEISKTYNPQKVEDKIYKKWEEFGFFNPDNLELLENAEKFSISMPPPNATGVLHLGHASMLAYQDLMVRYNRMQGKKTLWLPGTDHASIATQTKVEKIIAEKGQTKYDLGREKFLEQVNEYVENSQSTIKNQTRKMGSSCDWERERYTLDDGLSRAVREVFVKMYNDKLIYQGDRIVNWCPRCESTLADDEVEHKDKKANLYYFKYNKDFPITIATTRPETKLGDTAVAVNPKDERYQKYIGQIFEINLGNGVQKIKIITDREVEMDFGTGALGVTPAHSMTDWEMAEKNDLEKIKIIGEDGKMNANAGKDYKGLTVLEAREKFVKYLEENNLIEKVEEVEQALSICYRCGTSIEPLPSKQWFVAVDKKITIKGNKYFQNKSLKEVALEVVNKVNEKDKEKIEIIPERFSKTYHNWMENLHDWCISRQIWFGHQIPVWYKNNSKDSIYVGTKPPEKNDWIQDKDTLDTWFSSGLWTFSTLLAQDNQKYETFEEWVANSPDLKNFHPTSVMETGYDILFFWIARMILMTTYTLGEIPFENVYLHGMVRDKQGRKMSKSLGNGIDPIEMIEKYGTDALRLSMIIGSSPGNDLKLYEEKIEGYRNFVNKLWNVSRYILTNYELNYQDVEFKEITLSDEWILNEMRKLIIEVKSDLDNYKFSQAGEKLKEFIWDKFADWYLETSKFEKNKEKKIILKIILQDLLKLAHPFIPFVTEQIWQEMGEEKMLIVENFPQEEKYINILNLEKIKNNRVNKIHNIIRKIRNARIENGVEINRKIKSVIYAGVDLKLIQKQELLIKNLRTGIEELEIKEKGERIDNEVYLDIDGVEVYLIGMIDKEKEDKRIKKEIIELKKYIIQINKKLDNATFVKNAPQEIVEKETSKHRESTEKLEKLEKKIII